MLLLNGGFYSQLREAPRLWVLREMIEKELPQVPHI